MINSGQCSDPAPRQEGCDPEACSERAGGDHAETCECFGCGCLDGLETESELRALDGNR